MYDFNRPLLMIEKAQRKPKEVIEEIFGCDSKFMLKYFKDWLHAAMSSDYFTYEEANRRSLLLFFCEQVEALIAALDVVHFGTKSAYYKLYAPNKSAESDFGNVLTKEQVDSPKTVIISFFKKFNIIDVRRELWIFLDAAIAYDIEPPIEAHPRDIFSAYKDISCLIEASYYLMQEEVEN